MLASMPDFTMSDLASSHPKVRSVYQGLDTGGRHIAGLNARVLGLEKANG